MPFLLVFTLLLHLMNLCFTGFRQRFVLLLFLQLRHIALRFLAQHCLIVLIINPPDLACCLQALPQVIQVGFQRVHIFDCFRHRTQVFLRQHQKRIAQNLIEHRWLKIFGELRRTQLNQQIRHLLIFLCRFKSKYQTVHRVHIFALAVHDTPALTNPVAQLQPGTGNLLVHILIKEKIPANPPSITDVKIPGIQLLSTAGTQSDPNRQVIIPLFALQLQIQICRPFLPLIALF